MKMISNKPMKQREVKKTKAELEGHRKQSAHSNSPEFLSSEF